MSENKSTFEKALIELEEIIEKLDVPNKNIEEAIKLHSDGIAKYKECVEKLDEINGKIEVYKKEIE